MGNLCYVGMILLVQALGGWQNIYFLIAELRVPPRTLGSVNMIAINTALSLGFFTPYLVILPEPIPLLIALIVTTICYASTFYLPPPGSNLPKVKEDKDGNKTVDLTEGNADMTVNNAIKSLYAPTAAYAIH